MNLSMTRNQLYIIRKNIEEMRMHQPHLYFLLQKQISLFYQKAKLHLDVMDARFNDIRDKYVQKDDAGNYLFEGDGENRKYKFITSKIDLEKARVLDVSMVQQEFEKACQQFFMQSISFDW